MFSSQGAVVVSIIDPQVGLNYIHVFSRVLGSFQCVETALPPSHASESCSFRYTSGAQSDSEGHQWAYPGGWPAAKWGIVRVCLCVFVNVRVKYMCPLWELDIIPTWSKMTSNARMEDQMPSHRCPGLSQPFLGHPRISRNIYFPRIFRNTCFPRDFFRNIYFPRISWNAYFPGICGYRYIGVTYFPGIFLNTYFPWDIQILFPGIHD